MAAGGSSKESKRSSSGNHHVSSKAGSGSTTNQTNGINSKYVGSLSLITFAVLAIAWITGFLSRLFSVIRFESIIHEFDPWWVVNLYLSILPFCFWHISYNSFLLCRKICLLICVCQCLSYNLSFNNWWSYFCLRFNYRATAYMVEHDFYKFLNWFDDRAWYPLGRIVGGTVYPGLMITSGSIHYILSLLNIPVHIRDICVFLAPVFR